MRRKPMLLNKILDSRKNQKRDIIGLLGAHRGAGVTYTGLMIAFYMGEELGKKTAFLECNSHNDLSRIQSSYEWNREEASFFSFGNITCFKNVTLQRIPGILSDDFECCILDFATDFTEDRDEFLRCGTKIIVGGQAEWNRLKLLAFIRSVQSIRGSETWLHFIPYADQKVITGMKKELERSYYAVPFEADPAILHKKTCRLFDSIFC